MIGGALSSAPRRGATVSVAIFVAVFVVSFAVPGAAASNDPLFVKQWGLSKIRAEIAWQKGTGAGTTIAIVDTGVDLAHEDLAVTGKLVLGPDYIDGGDPRDEEGHGTHVAGIAAGAMGNGRGVAGVAPGAKIMVVRVLDENGACAGTCKVSDGIRWAADHGAKVINLSLASAGQEVFGPSFSAALEYAWSKGAIPVVAAGNSFLLSSGYEDDPALVVSATDSNDTKPDFSNGVGGAKWGIAAPGGGNTFDWAEENIVSTYWDRSRPNEHNLYAYIRGTSQAAPHVSGAAAVLLGLGLSPQQTVDRLLGTAKDLGAPGRDSTFGYGRLDLGAAVQGLGGTASPSPTNTGGGVGTPSPGSSPVGGGTPSGGGGGGGGGSGSSGSGGGATGSGGTGGPEGSSGTQVIRGEAEVALGGTSETGDSTPSGNPDRVVVGGESPAAATEAAPTEPSNTGPSPIAIALLAIPLFILIGWALYFRSR